MICESWHHERKRCIKLGFLTDSDKWDFLPYYMNCRVSFIAVKKIQCIVCFFFFPSLSPIQRATLSSVSWVSKAHSRGEERHYLYLLRPRPRAGLLLAGNPKSPRGGAGRASPRCSIRLAVLTSAGASPRRDGFPFLVLIPLQHAKALLFFFSSHTSAWPCCCPFSLSHIRLTLLLFFFPLSHPSDPSVVAQEDTCRWLR